MTKILVTSFLTGSGMDALKDSFHVTHPEKGQRYKRDQLLTIIPKFHGILVAGGILDAEIIRAAKNLKIISVFGAGYDNINVEEASKRNIMVANAPDSVTEATAEFTLGLMLNVMRNISVRDRWLRNNPGAGWGMLMKEGQNLIGKTLGIVGLGRIGKAVAKRALVFGMKVVYYKRHPLSGQEEKGLGVSYLPLDDLLKNADVVSLNLPLTKESRHLIGQRELNLMKSSAFLINTARGGIIDEGALVRHLQMGKIAGAGLDVFENEPKIPNALLKLDNVVLTPHIGTATPEIRVQVSNEACKNIIDFFDGKIPVSVVNPEVIKNIKG